MARGWTRQAGWRAATTGIAALSLEATRVGLRALDDRLGAGGRVAGLPVAVPLGLTIAFVVDRRREVPDDDDVTARSATPPLARSVLVAAGVEGGLAAVAYAEHALAGAAGRRLAEVLPGGPQLWRLVAHGASLGVVAVTATKVWDRAMRGIEAGAAAEEPVFGGGEGERWTGPTLSGGPGSLVPWSTLGKEGRRHMLTHVRPTPAQERPTGFEDLPDLSIETVMGEPATAAPVQVYVGLESAPTVRERVDLALAEMERTGAFDRSLLVLVSPTGLGYVNYVALAATQYLSRGDMASVTMQYSRRPSPLSLGRVGQAREQNRLLWLRILERVRQMEGPRPRVVLFGESLGAHTSQDVFLHWGTLGLQALGIDRALWIGTPYGSEWMHEVTGPERLDVDRDRVAVVNDLDQLHTVTQERGALPPYVMLSHDNDGVTKFGPDLLTTAPAWLGPQRPRVERVDGASPRGIPAHLRWRPVTTFFQTLRRRQERAGARHLPGVGPRLPARPGRVRQRGLRPARVPGAAGPGRRRRPAARGGPLAGVPGGLSGHRSVADHRHAIAAATMPSPLVAQCSRAGASRLPLWSRSTPNTTPASAVNATVPATCRRCSARVTSPVGEFARAPSTAGSTCQNPKSTAVTPVAHSAP